MNNLAQQIQLAKELICTFRRDGLQTKSKPIPPISSATVPGGSKTCLEISAQTLWFCNMAESHLAEGNPEKAERYLYISLGGLFSLGLVSLEKLETSFKKVPETV